MFAILSQQFRFTSSRISTAAVSDQGDQIGRFFAVLAIAYILWAIF
jgi:hypothetical protein